jgi:HSP20 family protein
MDIKKLNPWNWFKKEENETPNVPVQRGDQPYADPLVHLHREFDRLFDDAFRRFGLPGFSAMNPGRTMPALATDALLKPSLNIAETEKEYTITVEVPGVDEKDLHLELADGTLTITGEKKLEKEEKEKNFYRMERTYGSFRRVLSLPEDADDESVEASYKNGVLTIRLSRKADAGGKEPKRIEIKK